MPDKQKIEYSQLETGFEFPPSSYKLDSTMVVTYLKAVEEKSKLYQDTSTVPPMAIAAHAMAALSEGICLPPGTIHVSQEFAFLDTANVDDTFTSYARVGKKQSRGTFNLLVVDLDVTDQDMKKVLTGKTSFILPEYSGVK